MQTIISRAVSARLENSRKKFFIPCVFQKSLLEAVPVKVKSAVRGDVILNSPACSSFDQLRKIQSRGEVSPQVFPGVAATIGRGGSEKHPNRQTAPRMTRALKSETEKNFRFAPGFFEEKPRRESNKKPKLSTPPHMKGRLSAPQSL